jgi:hypothetical protein
MSARSAQIAPEMREQLLDRHLDGIADIVDVTGTPADPTPVGRMHAASAGS